MADITGPVRTRVTGRLEGAQELTRQIDRFEAALRDGLPRANENAAKFMQQRLTERFKSDGYGEWDDIQDESLRSRRVRTDDPDPALTDGGDLWKDFSTPYLEETGGATARFETDRADARAHDQGHPHTSEPARPFAYFDDTDAAGVVDAYRDQIERGIPTFFEGGSTWD